MVSALTPAAMLRVVHWTLRLKIYQTGSALTMETCWFSHVYIISMNFISVCVSSASVLCAPSIYNKDWSLMHTLKKQSEWISGELLWAYKIRGGKDAVNSLKTSGLIWRNPNECGRSSLRVKLRNEVKKNNGKINKLTSLAILSGAQCQHSVPNKVAMKHIFTHCFMVGWVVYPEVLFSRLRISRDFLLPPNGCQGLTFDLWSCQGPFIRSFLFLTVHPLQILVTRCGVPALFLNGRLEHRQIILSLFTCM